MVMVAGGPKVKTALIPHIPVCVIEGPGTVGYLGMAMDHAPEITLRKILPAENRVGHSADAVLGVLDFDAVDSLVGEGDPREVRAGRVLDQDPPGVEFVSVEGRAERSGFIGRCVSVPVFGPDEDAKFLAGPDDGWGGSFQVVEVTARDMDYAGGHDAVEFVSEERHRGHVPVSGGFQEDKEHVRQCHPGRGGSGGPTKMEGQDVSLRDSGLRGDELDDGPGFVFANRPEDFAGGGFDPEISRFLVVLDLDPGPRDALVAAARDLGEETCTWFHGFCEHELEHPGAGLPGFGHGRVGDAEGDAVGDSNGACEFGAGGLHGDDPASWHSVQPNPPTPFPAREGGVLMIECRWYPYDLTPQPPSLRGKWEEPVKREADRLRRHGPRPPPRPPISQGRAQGGSVAPG
jgi:hypothetical protein